MRDLEGHIEEIENAKKELKGFGLLTHFGGEMLLAVSLVIPTIYSINKYGFIPEIPEPGALGEYFNLMSKTVGLGIFGNVVLQPFAFLLKAVSLSQEGNYEMARHFEDRGSKIFSRFHDYFYKNPEIGEKVIEKYIGMKNKFGID